MPRILLPVLMLGTGFLGGCGSGATPVELRFGVADEDAATVRALQFYVHAIELIDEHGKPHPFRLATAEPWQNEHVALIDIARHASVQGTVDHSTFSAVRFTVGVPFDLNHSNPLVAAAPLDRGEMFWNWQSGHKFLRADVAVDGREWSLHLGSTGCSSASALRPPAQPCLQPNEMRIELKGDPVRGAIRLRLPVLAAAARSAKFVVCTGDYLLDPACKDAYAAVPQRLWTLQ